MNSAYSDGGSQVSEISLFRISMISVTSSTNIPAFRFLPLWKMSRTNMQFFSFNLILFIPNFERRLNTGKGLFCKVIKPPKKPLGIKPEDIFVISRILMIFLTLIPRKIIPEFKGQEINKPVMHSAYHLAKI